MTTVRRAVLTFLAGHPQVYDILHAVVGIYTERDARQRRATTTCGLTSPPRKSTSMAGSAWAASARSAEGL